MSSMDRFIESLNQAKNQTQARRRFRSRRYITLKYVTEEPEGWPLTRPPTKYEWAHVVKAMIMRRTPKHGPIHRGRLVQYVTADLETASEAGLLYVDKDFQAMRQVSRLLDSMCEKDQTLRTVPIMEDDEMGYPDQGIYRTEHAEGWVNRVPLVVRVVTDFLPTTSALDLMVQALIDSE